MAGIDNLTPWPKGVSGNPKGRARVPEEIKMLKGEAKAEVVEAIHRSLLMTMAELTATLKSPDTSIAQQLVARIIIKALKDGCYQRAQFLLNYVIGRPKQFEDGDNSAPDSPSAGTVLSGVPTNVLIEFMQHYQKAGSE